MLCPAFMRSGRARRGERRRLVGKGSRTSEIGDICPSAAVLVLPLESLQLPLAFPVFRKRPPQPLGRRIAWRWRDKCKGWPNPNSKGPRYSTLAGCAEAAPCTCENFCRFADDLQSPDSDIELTTKTRKAKPEITRDNRELACVPLRQLLQLFHSTFDLLAAYGLIPRCRLLNR
nr:hypothetical protein Iba_chr10cCG0310 [Ipomoea batatas]GMD44386.1 hypothetical protein Iba_chr10dCG0030 [Ipomoea batatas]